MGKPRWNVGLVGPMLGRMVVPVVGLVLGGASTGCRGCGAGPEPAPVPDAAGEAETPEEDAGPIDDASRPPRSLEARNDEARRDAGALDPACEGAHVSLLVAAVDARCAVGLREWAALVAEGSADGGTHGEGAADAGLSHAGPRGETSDAGAASSTHLRQTARREGEWIVLSVVNEGRVPILVPLRFHPGHPDRAFSVLAEDARRAVYELGAPAVDLPRAEEVPERTRRRRALPALDLRQDGEAPPQLPFARVHSAVIRLPPGGAASARFKVDPRIERRLDRACTDAGPADCALAVLPKGRSTLHLGQLVVAIDAGPPATLAWDAP